MTSEDIEQQQFNIPSSPYNNTQTVEEEIHSNSTSSASSSSSTSSIHTLPFIEWTSRCEDLLYFFGSHKAAGLLRNDQFLDKSFNFCAELFRRDGDIIIIDNYGSQELCDSYPIKIILQKSFIQHLESTNPDNPAKHTQHDADNDNDNDNNYEYLSSLLERARYARCFRRFVVPVIFLPNNACIARSSTLSTTGELLLNKATTVVSEALNYYPNSMESPMGHNLDALRAADIKLLKYFNIKFICDLMVEDKKKVGWGRYALTVTSSEKVDREQRYKDFNLSSIPYPGCEFFKRYKGNNHNGNRLIFEWDESIHDAKLNLHWLNEEDLHLHEQQQEQEEELNPGLLHHDIDWRQYQKWDIITLTQNYLRLIVDYIQSSMSNTLKDNKDNIGILIHCISGWDRTPLFISLLRLSLWADGIIHCDLDSSEILYLTLSYDWLLFTHQFGNRLSKGEDIFHFTFYMLQYLISDRYSIWNSKHNGYNNQLLLHQKNSHQNGHHHHQQYTNNNNKTGHHKILKKMKTFSQITKAQTKKIAKNTKNGSNKLISKLKSKSSTNILNNNNDIDKSSLDVSNSSFDDQNHNDNKQQINKYKTINHINKNGLDISNSSLDSNGIIKHRMIDPDHYHLSPFSPPLQIVTNPINPIKSKSVNIVSSTSNNPNNNNSNNINYNNLSHSWEKKASCAPLTNNIRHSYIPSQHTPPAFQKNRNIISLSMNSNSLNSTNSDPIKQPTNPQPLIPPNLQLVRTQPLNSNNTNNSTTPRAQIQYGKNYRLGSWQFVDNKNDSPMFQFIATPKSDPPPHPPLAIAPPELNLNLEKAMDDEHGESMHSPSDSHSSGDIKINTRYSLSAPSSAKKYQTFYKFKDFVMNASPSPDVEVVAHPETNIIDMQDNDNENENHASNHPEHENDENSNSQLFPKYHIYRNLMMDSMSKEEENEMEQNLSLSRSSYSHHRDMKSELNNIAAGDIAKALVDDVIQNVITNTLNKSSTDNEEKNDNMDEDDQREDIEDDTNNISDSSQLVKMEAAKSTPVTISDFLGLDGARASMKDINGHNTKIIQQHTNHHQPQQDQDQQKKTKMMMMMNIDEEHQCNPHDKNNHNGHFQSLSENNLKDIGDLAPQLKKVESFEINVDDVLDVLDNHQHQQEQKQNNNNNNNDDDDDDQREKKEDGFCIKDGGRLTASNRADKLMQVHTLFNKVYTQVMIINDPPIFYKQSVQSGLSGQSLHDNIGGCGGGGSDNLDFISSESYFGNNQSEPYNNIATYLKSILPTALVGNGQNGINDSNNGNHNNHHKNEEYDEYDDDDD